MHRSAAAIIACLSVCSLAQADELRASVRKPTSIAAQPLGPALQLLARQRGFQIVYLGEEIDAVHTPGCSGELTTQEALGQLLKGTGLTYRLIDDGVSIVPLPSSLAPDVEVPVTSTSGIRSRMQLADGAQVGEAPSRSRVARAQGARHARLQGNADELDATALQDGLEVVLVTGTHIRGLDNRTAPILTFTDEDFDRAGISTAQDFLRSLPQNFAGGEAGASEDGGFGFGSERTLNYSAATGINLRGLGDSSTLVLVNGHRLAPSNIGTTVDVSLLPMAAVERIDVLTDGSSSIYGADAVAGLVNFVLRNDYEGSQTRMRYGSVTDGGRQEELVAHTTGGSWNGGNAIVSLQYQHFSPLLAADRSFGAHLTAPNEMLPETHAFGGALHATQQMGERFEAYSDVLYSRKSIDRETSALRPGNVVRFVSDTGETATLNAVVGALIQPTERWALDVSAEHSSNDTDRLSLIRTGASMIENNLDVQSQYRGASAIVSGRMSLLPAGDLGVAFGVSYRDEHTELSGYSRSGANVSPLEILVDRSTRAAFGELYVPLIGSEMRVPAVHAFDLSLAARYDDFSDFGSSTNPRVGVRWSPVADLSLRASASTSFRAPNANEVQAAANEFIFTTPLLAPGGGTVPAIVLQGGGLELTAEEAESLALGLEYAPQRLPGLTIGINYYKVKYQDRIVFPPFDATVLLNPQAYGVLLSTLADDAAAQAFIDAALARGAQDFGADATGARHVFDARQRNAAEVIQSGFDFNALYRHEFRTGTFSTRASVSVITEIDTRLVQGAVPVDLVDTVSNPATPRVRLDGTWATGRWSGTLALNYVGEYVDNFTLPHAGIDDWLTADLSFSVHLGDALGSDDSTATSLLISVQNALDEDPPYVRPRVLTAGALSATYDNANAGPLGRFVALELRHNWR